MSIPVHGVQKKRHGKEYKDRNNGCREYVMWSHGYQMFNGYAEVSVPFGPRKVNSEERSGGLLAS